MCNLKLWLTGQYLPLNENTFTSIPVLGGFIPLVSNQWRESYGLSQKQKSKPPRPNGGPQHCLGGWGARGARGQVKLLRGVFAEVVPKKNAKTKSPQATTCIVHRLIGQWAFPGCRPVQTTPRGRVCRKRRGLRSGPAPPKVSTTNPRLSDSDRRGW